MEWFLIHRVEPLRVATAAQRAGNEQRWVRFYSILCVSLPLCVSLCLSLSLSQIRSVWLAALLQIYPDIFIIINIVNEFE